MSTNFPRKTRLFPRISQEYQQQQQQQKGGGREHAVQHASVSRLIFKLPALRRLLPTFCLETACLRFDLYVRHSHIFTMNCFGVWRFIPMKRCAAALFSLCCRAILIDHRLVRLSGCALRFVVIHPLWWNFKKWKFWIAHRSSQVGLGETGKHGKKKVNTVLPT